MIIGARPEVGPMAVFASILLTMSVGLSNAASASASPDRSRLPQLLPPGRIAGVIPRKLGEDPKSAIGLTTYRYAEHRRPALKVRSKP